MSVLSEVEGEVSVMESGNTDNDTTKTDIDISSDEDDHDESMIEGMEYWQIEVKKRLNQIMENGLLVM